MTGRRNALAAREAIEAAHPEIMIKSPLTSLSRSWELSVEGDNTIFDNFWRLVDHLAAKFGEIESGAGEDADDGRPEDRYQEIQVVPDRE